LKKLGKKLLPTQVFGQFLAGTKYENIGIECFIITLTTVDHKKAGFFSWYQCCHLVVSKIKPLIT